MKLLYSYFSLSFRSGSLKVNYTVVTSDSALSGQEFTVATNDLANGTYINVFGTPTKALELAVNRVDGNFIYHTVKILKIRTPENLL